MAYSFSLYRFFRLQSMYAFVFVFFFEMSVIKLPRSFYSLPAFILWYCKQISSTLMDLWGGKLQILNLSTKGDWNKAYFIQTKKVKRHDFLLLDVKASRNTECVKILSIILFSCSDAVYEEICPVLVCVDQLLQKNECLLIVHSFRLPF